MMTLRLVPSPLIIACLFSFAAWLEQLLHRAGPEAELVLSRLNTYACSRTSGTLRWEALNEIRPFFMRRCHRLGATWDEISRHVNALNATQWSSLYRRLLLGVDKIQPPDPFGWRLTDLPSPSSRKAKHPRTTSGGLPWHKRLLSRFQCGAELVPFSGTMCGKGH
jgi:hypothetical protein